MGKYIKYYKKFYEWCEEDLWGHIALSQRNTKVLNYLYRSFQGNIGKNKAVKKKLFKKRKSFTFSKKKFLYEIHTEEREFKRKKRRFRSKEYFNLFKLCMFYGNMKASSLKSLLNTQATSKNIWAGATPFLLESRLDILLYRTNLFKSIFFVKQFIRHKGVLVNGLSIKEPNFQVQIGNIVTIPPKFYKEFYTNFVKNLKENRILVNHPRYMEVDYKIGSFIVITPPKGGEVYYPFKISAKTHWFSK